MAEASGQDVGGGLRRRDYILLGSAIALLVVALFLALVSQTAQTRSSRWLETVRSIPDSVARIALVSGEINRGVTPDLQVISTLTADVDDLTLGLIEGNEIYEIPALPASMQEDAEALRAAWGRLQTPLSSIIRVGPDFDIGVTEARRIAEAVRGPEGLYPLHLDLAQRLVASQARPAASVLLAQQMAGLDRFAGTATRLFSEGRDARLFYEQMTALLKDALHNPADRRQYDSGRGMLKGVT